ncbi:hypothetical protein MKJ01_07520 [Chryseobacterium sp. SSA4.19]|uniref:hypothetical protein n=1 Tax=Chryseobacterium sp. SSA4.19 TaxID=2919915 RepID=UPI001F4D82C7|nr:hypothetical protein [Chryseobacterium sp. SSA4.19]MCJ8153611.1 hypothetical protein [Chryseobacterium sp. SSA4.19]
MKKILLITGVLIGIFFSLWDSMTSYADTAPIDDEIGIEIISWPFFIKKTIIYMVIGGLTGFLTGFIIHKLIRSEKKVIFLNLKKLNSK